MSEEHAKARRWVPWICAYTGARVNEITQLLPSDFKIKKGIRYIRIDAEAAKTGDYREVPLHQDLIDQGLIAYMEARGKRPLFYDPERTRGGRDNGKHFRKTGERLADWIRSEEVGVTDTKVAPNHGWRHRFSSVARHADMHPDVQNIIQGHAGDKVASDYGDAWIETAYREIMKIPEIRADGVTTLGPEGPSRASSLTGVFFSGRQAGSNRRDSLRAYSNSEQPPVGEDDPLEASGVDPTAGLQVTGIATSLPALHRHEPVASDAGDHRVLDRPDEPLVDHPALKGGVSRRVRG
jgi:hypothetical protein